jgi:hypothetical protein
VRRRRPEMPGRLEARAATSCSGWSTFSRHPPCRHGPAAAERDLTTRRSTCGAVLPCMYMFEFVSDSEGGTRRSLKNHSRRR